MKKWFSFLLCIVILITLPFSGAEAAGINDKKEDMVFYSSSADQMYKDIVQMGGDYKNLSATEDSRSLLVLSLLFDLMMKYPDIYDKYWEGIKNAWLICGAEGYTLTLEKPREKLTLKYYYKTGEVKAVEGYGGMTPISNYMWKVNPDSVLNVIMKLDPDFSPEKYSD